MMDVEKIRSLVSQLHDVLKCDPTEGRPVSKDIQDTVAQTLAATSTLRYNGEMPAKDVDRRSGKYHVGDLVKVTTSGYIRNGNLYVIDPCTLMYTGCEWLLYRGNPDNDDLAVVSELTYPISFDTYHVRLPFNVVIRAASINNLHDVYYQVHRVMRALVDYIQCQPPVKEESGWISVTDRKPEKEGRYLVRVMDQLDHGLVTDICEYSPDLEEFGHYLTNKYLEQQWQPYEVHYWKELPEGPEE